MRFRALFGLVSGILPPAKIFSRKLSHSFCREYLAHLSQAKGNKQARIIASARNFNSRCSPKCRFCVQLRSFAARSPATRSAFQTAICARRQALCTAQPFHPFPVRFRTVFCLSFHVFGPFIAVS